jgi:hypothetical protein
MCNGGKALGVREDVGHLAKQHVAATTHLQQLLRLVWKDLHEASYTEIAQV